MKIALLIETTGRGGAETALVNLVRHLDRGRFTPVAATGGPGWLTDELRALGAAVHHVPPSDGARVSLPTFESIVRFLQAHRPAVVHTWLFQMNLYGALAARMMGLPVVTGIRSKHYELAKWYRIMAWQVLARVSDVVTINSADLRDTFLHHARPRAPQRVVVIPNGVEVQRFAGAKDGEILRRLGIADFGPVIVTVGRTHPVKGQRFLIQAMGEVVRDFPQARLLVIGAAMEPEFTGLHQTVARLGLSRHVIFAGARDDVPHLLQAADLFVLPSLSEGMSNALLEAMAAGLPVIATAVGGNSEVIGRNGIGALVPPGDAAALAGSMRAVLAQPNRARAMGERAQQHVAARYGLQPVADAYCSIYEQLASGVGVRAAAGGW